MAATAPALPEEEEVVLCSESSLNGCGKLLPRSRVDGGRVYNGRVDTRLLWEGESGLSISFSYICIQRHTSGRERLSHKWEVKNLAHGPQFPRNKCTSGQAAHTNPFSSREQNLWLLGVPAGDTLPVPKFQTFPPTPVLQLFLPLDHD